MTAPAISVIIPTVWPNEGLIELIKQLIAPEIYEIIVVRPEQTELALNPAPHCKWLTAPKGRGPQIQAGLDVAQGDIIWILHSDSDLPENAAAEIVHILQTPSVAMGSFTLTFNDKNLSLKLFSLFSRLSLPWTTFGDQGFFFYHTMKNNLPDLTDYPLLEDVIIYRSLRKKGRIVKSKYQITTDANRFRRIGMWRTQWQNAKILWKFRQGVSATELYNHYYL